MSNCVGLAWGLFNLDRGRGRLFKRLTGDAGELYAKAYRTGSGFMTSKTPKSSSIACYGVGEYGHVVYILHAFEPDRCVGIESNYSGTTANGRLLRVKIGNPKKWYAKYQGCITDFT